MAPPLLESELLLLVIVVIRIRGTAAGVRVARGLLLLLLLGHVARCCLGLAFGFVFLFFLLTLLILAKLSHELLEESGLLVKVHVLTMDDDFTLHLILGVSIEMQVFLLVQTPH